MYNTAFVLLVLAAFVFAFAGVGAGRILGGLSLVLLLVDAGRRRRWPHIPALAWFCFAFLLIAVISTVINAEPGMWDHGLHKLLPWLLIVPIAWIAVRADRLATVLKAFAVGGGVLAVRTFAGGAKVLAVARAEGLPWGLNAFWQTVSSHHRIAEHNTVLARLVASGDMQDGQRLMVGVILTLAFVLGAVRSRRERGAWGLLLAAEVLALLLTFKRAAIIGTACMVVVLLLWQTALCRWCTVPVGRWLGRRGWALLLLLVLAAGSLCVLPSTRRAISVRVESVRERVVLELVRRSRRGGRTCMWLQVAPVLVKRSPWLGIGFKSLTNEQMHKIAPQIEPHQTHLHSNVVQVLVATGLIGLAAYLAWIARAVWDGFRLARGAVRFQPKCDALSASLVLALIGLFLDGLFEYQLGSGQIVLVYTLLMGCIAGGRAAVRGAEFPAESRA